METISTTPLCSLWCYCYGEVCVKTWVKQLKLPWNCMLHSLGKIKSQNPWLSIIIDPLTLRWMALTKSRVLQTRPVKLQAVYFVPGERSPALTCPSFHRWLHIQVGCLLGRWAQLTEHYFQHGSLPCEAGSCQARVATLVGLNTLLSFEWHVHLCFVCVFFIWKSIGEMGE